MTKSIKAFTLIELLIVVSVIGILSGIVIKVIDVNKTKGKARDGVRISTMGKLVQGLEAYCIAEEACPTNTQVTAMAPTDKITNYIKEWPAGTPDSTYNYIYNRLADQSMFTLYVKAERQINSCYKYTTDKSILQFCTGSSCNNTATIGSDCDVIAK